MSYNTLKFGNSIIKTYADASGAKLEVYSTVTGELIVLPAFLTDISQTFSSTWNTENVYGRMDPIATFQGTQRSISISLDLPAGNKEVAKHNLGLCERLVAYLYPGYKTAYALKTPTRPTSNIIAKPPLLKIKFGNLISSGAGDGRLLGYIDSLTFNPVTDAGMFASGGIFYPKVISLSFGFNVLHQETMGSNESNKWMPKKLPFGGD